MSSCSVFLNRSGIMRVYVFGKSISPQARETVLGVLRRIARHTPTDDLVVAVYLREGNDWHAHASVDSMARSGFGRARGKWAFVRDFDIPADLPPRYRIIRIALGTGIRYPGATADRYGWRLRCQRLDDHLAYVFAHELHHFRRHHLGMHPGEGEQSACKWALARALEEGFHIEGRRETPKGGKRRPVRLRGKRDAALLRRVKDAAAGLCLEHLEELVRWASRRATAAGKRRRWGKWTEHFGRLRALPDGAPLHVVGDDLRKGYLGQTATKVRNLRCNSYRMAVRTADGKEWRWPMQWLQDAGIGQQGALFDAAGD